jgi:putative peptidoglycan lipid II flippase
MPETHIPATQPHDGIADESKTITRRAGVVAFFTLLSRVLGAARDMVVFHIFGATAATDAFLVAFTIPNVFRRLVAEGALSIAFVPIYLEARAQSGEAEARRFCDAAFGLTLLFTSVVTIAGMVGASFFVMLFASGFAADPAQFALATELTRWMFPYMIAIALVAMCMGLLNANHHFAAPAAAPVVLNAAIIACAFFSNLFDPPVFGLAVGVLVGGAAQLALQIPALMKYGLMPRPTLQFGHPYIRKLIKLMVPAVFGLAVYQINLIVLRQIASYLPAGRISYYYNADRLMELALGVFAISIATASLPTLSDHAARKDHKALARTFVESLRLTNFVTIPAAVGLCCLATPIVSVLYLHGQYSFDDVDMTARTLFAFAPALVAIATMRLATQTFYTLADTRTPVEIAAVALVVNTLLGFALVQKFDVVGLAASLTITSVAQAVALLALLRRKVAGAVSSSTSTAIARQLCAATLMGAVVLGFAHLGDWRQGPHRVANHFVLFCSIFGGIGVYAAVNFLLGGKEAQQIVDAWRMRRSSWSRGRSFYPPREV